MSKVITTIKQGRYVEAGKFSSWVTRIAHNLIIDHYRQERNENLVSNGENEEKDIFNRKELSEGTIEDSIITRQRHADIRRPVAALPENQREVLIMRYYKNMSFKEIADATQVSISTRLWGVCAMHCSTSEKWPKTIRYNFLSKKEGRTY